MTQNRAQSRAIRNRMQETGESYTQARRALTSTTSREARAPGNSLEEIVAMLLDADRHYQKMYGLECDRLENDGYLLINGGQTDGNKWELVDYRTGSVLATGDDGIDGFELAALNADPARKPFHTDQLEIEDNDPFQQAIDTLISRGIPPRLVHAIADVVGQDSDEELAAYVAAGTAS